MTKKKRTISKEVLFLIVVFLVVAGFTFNLFYSEESKKERNDNILFQECIKEVAEDYCKSLDEIFERVSYDTMNGVEGRFYLHTPTKITCNNVRDFEGQKYKFLDEEIKFCLEALE